MRPLVHLGFGGSGYPEVAALYVERTDLLQIALFLRAVLALYCLHN
jgi:hypothetical protein